MKYLELDTPALLIDRERLMKNLKEMQEYADGNHVDLRPHTKTHKMPQIAAMQMEAGACGIAVAKVGEAEVMAEHGMQDIFIANEIVGEQKLRRIAALAKQGIKISFGVDTPCQVTEAERIFGEEGVEVPVLIEIEVGEQRSGIIEEEDFLKLLDTIKNCPHVMFEGLFSHDGNCYKAENRKELFDISEGAQRRTVDFAKKAEEFGMPCRRVSYGSTPTFTNRVPILEGITELRPGTYALMDTAQAHAIGTLDCCAATVLASVISKPTETRTILDVGAKGLTKQERKGGICDAPGVGTIFEYPQTHIDSMFDEHAILYDKHFHDSVEVGDKVRVIPVHICPVCNLYDSAVLISGDEVVAELTVDCRGRLQ